MRQHNTLTEYASRNGLSIEHCFFHAGTFDLQNPDDVLSRFLCCIKDGNAGLVLIESMDLISADQRDQFPAVQIYSVRNRILIRLEHAPAKTGTQYCPRTKVFGYFRHANTSQIDGG